MAVRRSARAPEPGTATGWRNLTQAARRAKAASTSSALKRLKEGLEDCWFVFLLVGFFEGLWVL